MIEAAGLAKCYDRELWALHPLDLQIARGEIYCLLGANGAGKTTTIDLLLGFIEPSAGRALINGIDVQRDPLGAKRHTAYMSENVNLYGNLTALQNIDFFAQLGGRGRLGAGAYREALERAGLPSRAFSQRVREFSKGMRQKVGIAISIIKEAPALLLDEPMSGLDPKAAADFAATLTALRGQGRAILMSTHDIFRAKELADRVGIMRSGHKVTELNRGELETCNLEALYLEIMAGA